MLEQVQQAEASYEVVGGDDPPARSRPQARPDQPRSLAQPVRAPAASASRPSTTPRPAIRRRWRSSISPRRSSRRPGAARRAEDQPRQHGHHVAGQRLRRQAARSIPAPGSRRTPSFISVVDISIVRLVANVVEKDLRRVTAGHAGRGRASTRSPARTSRAASPASRRCSIRRRAPRRSKSRSRTRSSASSPACTRKVDFTVDGATNALVVPDQRGRRLDGKRGVFMPGGEGDMAKFQPVDVGIDRRRAGRSRSG